MSEIWQTLLPTVLALLSLNLIKEAQLFEQRNVVYTTYVRNYEAVDVADGTGAMRLPNHVTIQRAPIETIKPAQLEQIRNSDELAPLLLELLRQTVPNWQQQQQLIQQPQLQQQQQQMQKQQQQHFFVYKNPQAVRLASQQPQILPEFNGVSVHQAQQQWQQQQQQQPQTVTLPQQQQQQQLIYGQLPMPIHLQQQQQPYLKYFQTTPKIASAPPATATTTSTTITATTTAATPTASRATQPPAEGFLAPIGTLTSGFQPTSPQAEDNSQAALCPTCCPPQPDMPCSCCNITPFLGAAALKSSVG